MHIWIMAYVSVLMACMSSFAQGPPTTVIEGKEEILYLDHWANPQNWRPAECEIRPSERRFFTGRPALHMRVPVDHHGGEAKYPIGWPRMDLFTKFDWERDWRAYDRLEFSVYTEMSPPLLPKIPITLLLYCPDKNRAFQRNLSELKLGEWVHFSIAVPDIKYADNVNVVKFSISESNYQDKDLVDFYFSGFRLVRSTECRISEWKILTPVLYNDQNALMLELTVVGVPEKISRGIPFSLRRGQELLRLETLPVVRGRQVLRVDVSELKLSPGEYTLIAFEQEPDKKLSVSFRVVSTPWEGK